MIETFWLIFVCYLVLFILSIKLKDNSIADVFWGLWFVLITLSLFIFESSKELWHIVVSWAITLWGIRLFILFFQRKLKKDGEDPRYAKWREEWKYFYTRSFFQVYLLQMLLMFTIAVPIFLIMSAENLNIFLIILWILVSLKWFAIEAVADYQVKNFIKNKTKWENIVYTDWLYKYSRNPNYFGESLFWLGISIASLWVSVFGIIGYVVITFLLLKVSWVPMKEESHSKKDNWDKYSKKTNKFIPWFPKKS